MNPVIRNMLALVAGLIVCVFVNSLLIGMSASVVPPPEGVDVNDMESIRANIHRFELKHFLFPFLAHALGSLVGAIVAAKLAATHKMAFAITVGCVHLLGGIAAAVMIPAPTWFIVLDLAVAYVPMGWLGGKLVTRSGQ